MRSPLTVLDSHRSCLSPPCLSTLLPPLNPLVPHQVEESLLPAKNLAMFMKKFRPGWSYDYKHLLDIEMVRSRAGGVCRRKGSVREGVFRALLASTITPSPTSQTPKHKPLSLLNSGKI
jgi:hypothetical protein